VGIHPYLDEVAPIAIAHRGGALEEPENTLEAFSAAVDLGYRYLETDVQLTADGVVVAFHDDSIDRVSNETGAISSWQWSELSQVPIEGTGRLASIDQLLLDFPDRLFNIDVKSDVVVEPLIDVLERLGAFDRVCVGSFSDARLRQARALATGNLCTSLGPRAVARQYGRTFGSPLPRPIGYALQIPTDFRGVPIITERFVERAHRDGFAVHVWTIDDADQMRELLDLGVDGIMTDRPKVLKAVFEERGLEL